MVVGTTRALWPERSAARTRHRCATVPGEDLNPGGEFLMLDVIFLMGVMVSTTGLLSAPCMRRPRRCREDHIGASSRAGLLQQKAHCTQPYVSWSSISRQAKWTTRSMLRCVSISSGKSPMFSIYLMPLSPARHWRQYESSTLRRCVNVLREFLPFYLLARV